MIYIEKDTSCTSVYKVDKVGGPYIGWSEENIDVWDGYDYTLYPNEDNYIQAFVAPSILDRWT